MLLLLMLLPLLQAKGGQHEGLNLTLDEQDASGLVAGQASVLSETEVCGLLQTEQEGVASLQRTVRSMMASLFVMWPQLSPADLAAKVWAALLPGDVQEAATPPDAGPGPSSSGPGSTQQLLADLVRAELRGCAAVLVALMEVSRSKAQQCATAHLQPWTAEAIGQLRVAGWLQRKVVVHGDDDATDDLY